MALTDCPCDEPRRRILRIPAGLSALPRQIQAFPEVRLALLEEVAKKTALDGWRARGERDFGVMWLEMWAYVADVLGFYDERIANESYLRTAVRRPSLRRIVDLLGYVPAPGVAGSAVIAAIADGRTQVSVPASAAFRSDAFGTEAPQVFEIGEPTFVHPFTNLWEIGPAPNASVEILPTPPGAPHAPLETPLQELTFLTTEFGLARGRLMLVTQSTGQQLASVDKVQPFEGKDGKTYVRVLVDTSIGFSIFDELASILVQTPTVVAVASKAQVDEQHPEVPPIDENGAFVFLDSVYRQIREGDVVLALRSDLGSRQILRVSAVSEQIVTVIQAAGEVPAARAPVTKIEFESPINTTNPSNNPFAYTFHFLFVDAGHLTRVADTEPTENRLRSFVGVPVDGLPDRPPAAVNGILERKFLLRDADNQGALVRGRMTFNSDGTASFQAIEAGLPPTMKTPISVFGNVLEVTRGESVFNEVLGNGDGRVARQQFKLKKKPLTYFFDPSVEGTKARSTLEIRVDDVLWREVRSFFGRGPQDQVYIVRHDDDGNTFVIFGDGVRGARLPSGIKNVRARYRFGSGEAAPPAGAIRQLARAVKGLRRVESPIAAVGGKDPDPPELLRTSAPQSVLIFGRAVSAADFEALANLVPGVIRATAEFLWIDSEQEAGVVVTYIGTALETDVLEALRKEAEPGLPLVARLAVAIIVKFVAEVEVDPRFDKDVVTKAVRAALVASDGGPLATRNAPIGQRIFRSAIFDTIQDVPGVAATVSASVQTLQGDVIWDLRFSSSPGPCAGAGNYYDFGDGEHVEVSGVPATAPVLDTGENA